MVDSRPRIRRAVPADAAALAELAARTFFDTYAHANTAEDMKWQLESSYGFAQQSRELSDPGWVTVVAESGSELVAYAQVRRNDAPPCVREPYPVEIYRFYVDRHWHGSGLGRRLMHAAHSAAASLGATRVWLGVWEENARARAFYAKCGFADAGETTFMVGSDRQTDRVLVAPIDTGELP